MARGVCEWIFDHLFERGWLNKGDICIDPFFGIGTTGVIGASRGVQVYGVELEHKFCRLCEENFKLHRHTWETFGDPLPICFQGDSRELGKVLGSVLFRGGGRLVGADVCVGSPPYEGSVNSQSHGIDWSKAGQATGNRKRGEGCKQEETLRSQLKYDECSEGQLGAMKSGDVDAVISSPPYQGSQQSQDGEFVMDSTDANPTARKLDSRTYFPATMDSDGQLTSLPAGDVADAIVSSPPYEGSMMCGEYADPKKCAEREKRYLAAHPELKGKRPNHAEYGQSTENLGNKLRDTFWHAAREIVQQCYAILKPGGIAAWVLKDFVRDGKRVPFSDDWRKLCESVEFQTVEWIKASLVKEERHPSLFGGDEVRTKQRKGFFRRLAEKKGSPRIDHEDVLIMQKDSSCLLSQG